MATKKKQNNTDVGPKRVLVLGGGIAGLSAAHELAERGFHVSVYEASNRLGGKARSMRVLGKLREPGTPPAGTPGTLPAEHGFRFFPWFYQHLPDTMSRIPAPLDGVSLQANAWQRRNVTDNLVDGDRVLLARQGSSKDLSVSLRPESLEEAFDVARFLAGLGLKRLEVPLAMYKLGELLARLEDDSLDEQTWWEFIEAGQPGRSEAYKNYLGEVAVRWTVAMDPKRASARSIGRIAFQFWKNAILNGFRANQRPTDRLLNGPTSETWIAPWQTYLETLGVKFHFEHQVESIELSGSRVTEVKFVGKGSAAAFDYCVAALPLKPMLNVLEASPSLARQDDAFRRMKELRDSQGWMIGLQFYLSKDVPIGRGGVFLKDSPWAITVISQPQFWQGKYKEFDYTGPDGAQQTVKGVLSVIIANWEARGDFQGKSARYCTPEEVKHEVWSELKAHLNDYDPQAVERGELLKDEEFIDWHYEKWDALQNCWKNDEELFINTVRSYAYRPEAVTMVPNFFLASDYVRTFTDLATMEAANEAARRAVNGILLEAHSPAKPCELWALDLAVGPNLAAFRTASRFAGVAGSRAMQDSRDVLGRLVGWWKNA